ncbi:uncharacterized protein LOC135823449 [Sycon ciliatum]|uniref:uncharacterized protein LOC135823449 n=1 Tax=Sycon ciliatum TaxID=27933 RepID=UPI0031F7210A
MASTVGVSPMQKCEDKTRQVMAVVSVARQKPNRGQIIATRNPLLDLDHDHDELEEIVICGNPAAVPCPASSRLDSMHSSGGLPPGVRQCWVACETDFPATKWSMHGKQHIPMFYNHLAHHKIPTPSQTHAGKPIRPVTTHMRRPGIRSPQEVVVDKWRTFKDRCACFAALFILAVALAGIILLLLGIAGVHKWMTGMGLAMALASPFIFIIAYGVWHQYSVKRLGRQLTMVRAVPRAPANGVLRV